MPPNMKVDTVRYKVLLSGKSGVGKTALAARLTGLDMPSMHYETTGTCFHGSLIIQDYSSNSKILLKSY